MQHGVKKVSSDNKGKKYYLFFTFFIIYLASVIILSVVWNIYIKYHFIEMWFTEKKRSLGAFTMPVVVSQTACTCKSLLLANTRRYKQKSTSCYICNVIPLKCIFNISEYIILHCFMDKIQYIYSMIKSSSDLTDIMVNIV